MTIMTCYAMNSPAGRNMAVEVDSYAYEHARQVSRAQPRELHKRKDHITVKDWHATQAKQQSSCSCVAHVLPVSHAHATGKIDQG